MTKWPAPVIRLYLGQMTFDAVLAAADDPNAATKRDNICVANFFGGELALQRSAKDEAARLFRAAAADCPRTGSGRAAARAELKALGENPPPTEQEAIGASPQPQRTEQEALGANPPRTEPEVQAPASSRVKLLGLELTELTSKLRSQYKIKDNVNGVLVTGVDPSIALAPGDVIVKVQDEAVASPAEMQTRLEQVRSWGKKITLLHVSNGDGETRFVALKLE